MTIKKCTFCGKENMHDALYCSYCGKAFSAEKTITTFYALNESELSALAPSDPALFHSSATESYSPSSPIKDLYNPHYQRWIEHQKQLNRDNKATDDNNFIASEASTKQLSPNVVKFNV